MAAGGLVSVYRVTLQGHSTLKEAPGQEAPRAGSLVVKFADLQGNMS